MGQTADMVRMAVGQDQMVDATDADLEKSRCQGAHTEVAAGIVQVAAAIHQHDGPIGEPQQQGDQHDKIADDTDMETRNGEDMIDAGRV